MRIVNLAEEAEDFTGNVWLIDGEEKVLIDTGTGDSWEGIRELDSVSKVVVTHSHYDHVDNLPKVKNKYDPEIYAFEPANLPVEDVRELNEGDTIELSGAEFEVYHTPGHKDDSICLHSPEERVLFTGDLIFPEAGFGRTDLEEGDRDVLIESIEKVNKLDVEAFYSGHGDPVMENADKAVQRSLNEAKKREPKY